MAAKRDSLRQCINIWSGLARPDNHMAGAAMSPRLEMERLKLRQRRLRNSKIGRQPGFFPVAVSNWVKTATAAGLCWRGLACECRLFAAFLGFS